MKRLKVKEGYSVYDHNGNYYSMAWSKTEAIKLSQKINGTYQKEPKYFSATSGLKKNPIKRKSVKRKKAKRKTTKRKPRVTVVRKNPRRVSFRETKSKRYSEYMLRAMFHIHGGPYYLSDNEKFYRDTREAMKFKTESSARDYVLRMKHILARKFPLLGTIQVVRAK